jgi:hypothetical protein
VGIITRSDILDFVLRDGIGRERNRSKSAASVGKRSRQNRRRAGGKAT